MPSLATMVSRRVVSVLALTALVAGCKDAVRSKASTTYDLRLFGDRVVPYFAGYSQASNSPAFDSVFVTGASMTIFSEDSTYRATFSTETRAGMGRTSRTDVSDGDIRRRTGTGFLFTNRRGESEGLGRITGDTLFVSWFGGYTYLRRR